MADNATGATPNAAVSAAPKIHPLVLDPEGDAAYHNQSVTGDAGSQPAFDLREGDVTLTNGMVKLAMRVQDLTAAPGNDDNLGGAPDQEQYVGMLGYDGGVFRLFATRQLSDGSWSTAGEWCPNHGVDDLAASNCHPVDHVTQQVDLASSLVVIGVDLISLNQALGADGGAHSQVAPGSVLVPAFETVALKNVPGGAVAPQSDPVDTARQDAAAPPYALGS